MRKENRHQAPERKPVRKNALPVIRGLDPEEIGQLEIPGQNQEVIIVGVGKSLPDRTPLRFQRLSERTASGVFFRHADSPGEVPIGNQP